MARVTENELRHWLAWARNYKEIENYTLLTPTPRNGRKWLIQLPEVATASGQAPGRERSVVPTEFVLTSRELLAFCYGLAVAGSRPVTRADFAAREWNW